MFPSQFRTYARAQVGGKQVSRAYKEKYREMLPNLRDADNESLRQRLTSASLSAREFCAMSERVGKNQHNT